MRVDADDPYDHYWCGFDSRSLSRKHRQAVIIDDHEELDFEISKIG